MGVPLFPFLKAALGDLAPLTAVDHDVDAHLVGAIGWLCRAHDVSESDGVSYGYSLRGGWRPAYIETTGYIIETFYELSRVFSREEYRARADRMARWLPTVQNPDGSFPNPRYAAGRGIVFDTGQDLFGLVRGYRELGDPQLLASARRAGGWLVEVADADARWTRCTHMGVPHVYNTRTAWALLELNAIFPHPDYVRVARANLDWAVSQQHPNGCFDNVAFVPTAAPFTHTIAYAIRGLWEANRLLPERSWEAAALRAANAAMSCMRNDGFVPGQIDVEGRPAANYCCLTGNAQLAIVWAKLQATTHDRRFRDAAVRALRYVMATQDLETTDLDIRGAIKGSSPIWGRYAPLCYPNWAAKFFIDALLLARGWL